MLQPRSFLGPSRTLADSSPSILSIRATGEQCGVDVGTAPFESMAYACAIIHTALRIAQGRIAKQARVEPEALSVPKLLPKVVAAAACLATAELVFMATVDANPGVKLAKPDWRDLPFASTKLGEILVEKRGPHRRKRRFCKARRIVRSLPGPPRKGPD